MTDRMTRNSQHGTQKPSAWYALGLKKVNLIGFMICISFLSQLFTILKNEENKLGLS